MSKMEFFQEAFINNLKSYRKARKLSQAKFAELCNVSNGTIGNIECGKTKPSFDLIITMSGILQCTPAELFHTTIAAPETSRAVSKDAVMQIQKQIQDFINSAFNAL